MIATFHILPFDGISIQNCDLLKMLIMNGFNVDSIMIPPYASPNQK